jgi:hypothetical protein
MAVALNPNAFLVRNTVGAPSSFSWCGWTRIDGLRGQEFTIVRYLAGNSVGGGGFQPTLVDTGQLIIFEAQGAFPDVWGGAGPTVSVGDWWFLGITTIVDDIPDNVEIYFALEGAGSLTQTTGSYSGAYQYQNHYIGARPGADGSDGAYRLDGSVAHDRVWHGVTLTPTEMLAEFQSTTAVKSGAWAVWPMADSATAIEDATANNRDLTSTVGTGSIVTTTGPSIGAGTDGTATPAAISLTAAVPRPATSTSAGPSTLAGVAALPRAGTSTGAGPSTVAGTTAVPLPAISTGAGPSTIAGTAALPRPATSTGAGPSTVAGTAALPALEAAGGATAQPAAIAGIGTVPTPSLSGDAAVTPTAVAASVGVGAPSASGGVVATPAVISALASVPEPAGHGGDAVTPATITVAASVSAPSVGVSAGPTALAATVALPPVVITAGATVTPATIALAIAMPSLVDFGTEPSGGTYREPAIGDYREPADLTYRETA